MRRLIGIYEASDIKAIQEETSFEYIEEIEAVDSVPGKNLYRVHLTDTYTEGGKYYECPRISSKESK